MLEVRTLLKSGGEYTVEHVSRMHAMIREHFPRDFRFSVYTDLPATKFADDVIVRKLEHDWPGWWSKMEMFRDTNVGFVFCIDLDMTIQKDIFDIAHPTDILPLKNFFCMRNLNRKIEGISTAMFGWFGDMSAIYEEFVKNDTQYRAANGRIGTPFWGDQGAVYQILKKLNIPYKFYQEEIRDSVCSYKETERRDVCSVIAYFGRTRPWTEKT